MGLVWLRVLRRAGTSRNEGDELSGKVREYPAYCTTRMSAFVGRRWFKRKRDDDSPGFDMLNDDIRTDFRKQLPNTRVLRQQLATKLPNAPLPGGLD